MRLFAATIALTLLLTGIAAYASFAFQVDAQRTTSYWIPRSGGYLETAFESGRDILINGADRYLNFNDTSGDAGYGFRDNSGNIEFKDSGGAWTDFNSLSGGGGSGSGLWATTTDDASIHPVDTSDQVIVGANNHLTSDIFEVQGDASIVDGTIHATSVDATDNITVGPDTISDITGSNLSITSGTLNAQDTDTTYTAGGTLLNLSGTTFSVNEGTLSSGNFCTFDGTNLVCNTSGSLDDDDLSDNTTTDLSEGTNLYYTDQRVADYIAGSSTILKTADEAGLESYLTDVSDVFTNNDGSLDDDDLSDNTTDDLSEGSTNLYYTDERTDDQVSQLLSAGSGISLSYDDGANNLTVTNTGSSGTDGQFSGVEATRDTTTDISSGSATTIPWDGELFDTDNYHDGNAATSSRLTVPSAGKYIIGGTVEFSAWSTLSDGRLQIRILKNGTAVRELRDNEVDSSGGDGPSDSFEAVVDLAADDYVELEVTQSSGGTRSLTTNSVFYAARLQGSGPDQLNELSDVDSVNYTAGRVLRANGSDYVSAQLNTSDLNNDANFFDTAGTALSSSGSTVNVDDVFLRNDQADSTSGSLTVNSDFTSSGTITFSSLTNCDTIDTDGSGVLSCGTDDAGTGSGGGLASTTPWNVGDLTKVVDDGTIQSTATSSPTIGSGLTYSGTMGNVVGGADGTLTADLGTEITFGEVASSDIITEAEGISSNDNDTTWPTSAAVKDYADTNDDNTTYSAGTALGLSGTTFNFTQTLSQGGTNQITGAEDINFTGTNDATVTVTDDADGTATVDVDVTDTDTTYTAGTGLNLSGTEFNVTGLTTSELSSGTLVTEAEGISSNDNDTTLPSSAAVKDYADSNDADTTYTAGGTLLTLSGTTFSINEGTLTDGNFCTFSSTGSQLDCSTAGSLSDDDLSDNVLNDIGDVSESSLSAGQVLEWDGSNWVNATDNTAAQVNNQTYTGSFVIGSTGSQSISGIGFSPNVVEFYAEAPVNQEDTDDAGASNSDTTDNFAGTMHGFARDDSGSITQKAIQSGGSGNSINAISHNSTTTDAIDIRYGDADGNEIGRVTSEVTSFDTDGFSINTETLNLDESGLVVHYTAYKSEDISGTSTAVSDNGSTVTTNTGDINFNSNLDVTDDGDGTVTIDGTGGSPAGSDGQVQYNSGGTFGASSNFAWDNAGTALDINGSLSLDGGTTDISSSEFNILNNGVDYTELNVNAGDVDFSNDTNATAGTGISFSGDEIVNDLGSSIDDTDLTAEDFGDITSDGTEDGVTIDSGVVGTNELDLTISPTWTGTHDFTGGSVAREEKVKDVTVASSSQEFVNGGQLPAGSDKDGITLTEYRCWVEGGTSVVLNLSDGTNNTETITCGTSVTSDTDVATNDTFNADEKMYLEVGSITGDVDYVHFEAYGTVTR